MKPFKNYLFITIILILLIGCNSKDDVVSFTGTIKEINNQQAIVFIEEGEILHSGNQVSVDLSVSKQTFQVGDHIRVTYDGEVRESFPLGINTVSVEVINEK